MEFKGFMDKIVIGLASMSIVGVFGMYVEVAKIESWKEMATEKVQEQDDLIIKIDKDLILINDRIKEIDKKLDEDKYITDEVNEQQMNQIRDKIIDERINELNETVEKLEKGN